MKIYLTITTDNGAGFYSGLSALHDARFITAYSILNENGVAMHDAESITDGVHKALEDLTAAIAAYEEALRVDRTHQIAATLWTNVEL
jgi:hypothetical protein